MEKIEARNPKIEIKKFLKFRASCFVLPVFVITVLLTFCPQKPSALEISLEENKGERGGVGYVDIQRVFKVHPETQRAKEEFEMEIRKREEGLNQKKAEILGMRAELARLKQEREFASRLPLHIPEASRGRPQASSAPISTPTQNSASPTVSPSTQTLLQLPGVGGVPVVSVSSAGPTAGVTVPAINLEDLDYKIAQKTADIKAKEQELRAYQKQVEKDLLDLENRKSQIILGRIYQAVREVAQSEGVSIVIDKKSILYGQTGVDLTEKLLKKLQRQGL
ncbi:MAG: OmpH family outer membrane protein [Elusimicrobia bacterium]|nr:OmpH family outer membrane protein [Elusimicrobiota bacterium]